MTLTSLAGRDGSTKSAVLVCEVYHIYDGCFQEVVVSLRFVKMLLDSKGVRTCWLYLAPAKLYLVITNEV